MMDSQHPPSSIFAPHAATFAQDAQNNNADADEESDTSMKYIAYEKNFISTKDAKKVQQEKNQTEMDRRSKLNEKMQRKIRRTKIRGERERRRTMREKEEARAEQELKELQEAALAREGDIVMLENLLTDIAGDDRDDADNAASIQHSDDGRDDASSRKSDEQDLLDDLLRRGNNNSDDDDDDDDDDGTDNNDDDDDDNDDDDDDVTTSTDDTRHSRRRRKRGGGTSDDDSSQASSVLTTDNDSRNGSSSRPPQPPQHHHYPHHPHPHPHHHGYPPPLAPSQYAYYGGYPPPQPAQPPHFDIEEMMAKVSKRTADDVETRMEKRLRNIESRIGGGGGVVDNTTAAAGGESTKSEPSTMEHLSPEERKKQMMTAARKELTYHFRKKHMEEANDFEEDLTEYYSSGARFLFKAGKKLKYIDQQDVEFEENLKSQIKKNRTKRAFRSLFRTYGGTAFSNPWMGLMMSTVGMFLGPKLRQDGEELVDGLFEADHGQREAKQGLGKVTKKAVEESTKGAIPRGSGFDRREKIPQKSMAPAAVLPAAAAAAAAVPVHHPQHHPQHRETNHPPSRRHHRHHRSRHHHSHRSSRNSRRSSHKSKGRRSDDRRHHHRRRQRYSDSGSGSGSATESSTDNNSDSYSDSYDSHTDHHRSATPSHHRSANSPPPPTQKKQQPVTTATKGKSQIPTIPRFQPHAAAVAAAPSGKSSIRGSRKMRRPQSKVPNMSMMDSMAPIFESMKNQNKNETRRAKRDLAYKTPSIAKAPDALTFLNQ